MQSTHYPSSLWRSFYRTLKVDVLDDFQTQVSEEDAEKFGDAVCKIALGCNRVVALLDAENPNDLAVYLGEIRESLEQVSAMLGESMSETVFKGALAVIDRHFEQISGAR